jgi:phosphoglucosamine mutase
VRVENGDRYVIEEMIKNDYSFGGEQSGHLIFKEFTTTGDGTISALQVLRVMKETGKKISQLKEVLIQYPQCIISVNVKEKRDFDSMNSVKEAISLAKANLGNEGRVIVRYSGTEKKARVMVEGKQKETVYHLTKQIADEIKKEIGD